MPNEIERLRRANKILRHRLKELHRMVTIDGLTGALTRYAIGALLEEEIEYATRHRSPLSVAMGDIDRFKLFNDQHGHLAGDAVLRHVGATLRKTMRSYERVGRYGGEEFLFIFRNTTGSNAKRAAERLRRALAESVCLFDEQSLVVTMSFGATQLRDDRVFALIERADSALYEAKGAGRNRVVLAR